MSSRYGIRSNGLSGGAWATSLEGPSLMAASLLGYGLIKVIVDVSLHDSYPKKLASDSEAHWLFSFHDVFFAQEILSIGVTPIGQIALASPGSPVRHSAAGVLKPNGTRHTIRLDFDGGGSGNAWPARSEGE